jgi:hypothetical protein
MVYLYRRAGSGWRQQQRLTSTVADDGFGAAVALEGTLLAVGAPRAPISPGPLFDIARRGRVDLYVNAGSAWVFETSLAPPLGPSGAPPLGPSDEMAFGASIAVADGVVAVGAPGSGTVHVFHREPGGWTEVSVLTPGGGAFDVSGGGFGSTISMRGGVLAIGAPDANGGAGAAYIAVRSGDHWSLSLELAGRLSPDFGGERFGTSVAVGDGMIVVGAPDFFNPRGGEDRTPRYGAVRVFERAGTSWSETRAISALAPRRFGSSVALVGHRLGVGAPGQGETDGNDLDRAAIFELRNGEWMLLADLDALQPPHGDEFGSAVALSEDFFVVTSPGRPPRGDRVTVFALGASTGGDR